MIGYGTQMATDGRVPPAPLACDRRPVEAATFTTLHPMKQPDFADALEAEADPLPTEAPALTSVALGI